MKEKQFPSKFSIKDVKKIPETELIGKIGFVHANTLINILETSANNSKASTATLSSPKLQIQYLLWINLCEKLKNPDYYKEAVLFHIFNIF